MPGNIIIWDMCTINDNQMMYVSWDTEHYRQNFWSFWPRDTISLHMCAINDNHMMYRCWDMDHDWQFFVILDHFFCLLPPNNPKNQHFEKNEKKPPGCMTLKKNQKIDIILHVSKIMITWCMVPEIWCATDGWTDRQMKKVTYRGGCPT